MSKQEEIREGMRGKLCEHDCEYGFGDLDLEDAVTLILSYLHSQGVVIKANKDDCFGMVEVEPLIKGK